MRDIETRIANFLPETDAPPIIDYVTVVVEVFVRAMHLMGDAITPETLMQNINDQGDTLYSRACAERAKQKLHGQTITTSCHRSFAGDTGVSYTKQEVEEIFCNLRQITERNGDHFDVMVASLRVSIAHGSDTEFTSLVDEILLRAE